MDVNTISRGSDDDVDEYVDDGKRKDKPVTLDRNSSADLPGGEGKRGNSGIKERGNSFRADHRHISRQKQKQNWLRLEEINMKLKEMSLLRQRLSVEITPKGRSKNDLPNDNTVAEWNNKLDEIDNDIRLLKVQKAKLDAEVNGSSGNAGEKWMSTEEGRWVEEKDPTWAGKVDVREREDKLLAIETGEYSEDDVDSSSGQSSSRISAENYQSITSSEKYETQSENEDEMADENDPKEKHGRSGDKNESQSKTDKSLDKRSPRHRSQNEKNEKQLKNDQKSTEKQSEKHAKEPEGKMKNEKNNDSEHDKHNSDNEDKNKNKTGTARKTSVNHEEKTSDIHHLELKVVDAVDEWQRARRQEKLAEQYEKQSKQQNDKEDEEKRHQRHEQKLLKRLQENMLEACEKRDLGLLQSAVHRVEYYECQRKLQLAYRKARDLLTSLERLQNLQLAIASLKASHVTEMRSLKCPQEVIRLVVKATCLVTGADKQQTKEWSDCQKLCCGGRQGLYVKISKFESSSLRSETASHVVTLLKDINRDHVMSTHATAAIFYDWTVGRCEEKLETESESRTDRNKERKKEQHDERPTKPMRKYSTN
jgi:hypothetical protein